jgi:thioredoxin reductase (NADPH)
VGGGDTALTEVIFLTRFAKKIHVIHRRDALRGAKYLQEQILNSGKVKVHWNSVVEEFQGGQSLESLKLKNVKTGEQSILPVTGCFIAIGITPNTPWLKNSLPTDEWGFIVTDQEMVTKTPGVFAAGDVRSKELWQIATAVGDGALAAYSVEKYLDTLRVR